MAVMTSQQPEGVAFEHKAEPVPSSDKMALDLDISGNSIPHETNFDPAPNDVALTQGIDLSPSEEFTALNVNGSANVNAFASNQTITSIPIDLPESHPTEQSASAPGSSQLADTNTTTTTDAEQVISSFQEPTHPDASISLASAEAVIDSAVEDTTASSTVPPVIEAEESDLRDATSPFAPEPIIPSQAQEQAQLPSPDLSTASDNLSAPQQQVDPIVTDVDREPVDSSLDPSSPSLPQHSDPQPPPHSSVDFDLSSQSEPVFLPATMDLKDTVMGDASESPQPVKIAREREDDDESGPLAKRTKTEDEAMEVETSGAEHPAPTANGDTIAIKSEGPPLTPHETKELIKILRNAARTADGKNFRGPVEKLWPALAASYTEKIANQIDLLTMENKLKGSVYRSMDDFKADLQLLLDNSITYNGLEHAVTSSARKVREVVVNKAANIPPENPVAPKKEKKTPRRSTPLADDATRATDRRRPRVGATSDAPAPTFALDPQTSTPLIRRDSTKADGGRPKREIHPPKSKDLVYSVRPKNKKYATELRFCEEVLNEMKKQKYQGISHPFLTAVDPVAMNIPSYYTIIKQPMDVGTITTKLAQGEYGSAKEFEKDVRLIFSNCYKFNPPPNAFHEMGKQYEQLFDAEWAKRQQWIADHQPAAASHSPTPDSEEEESEEDEAEVPMTGSSAAASRLIEEQNKLITLMTAKKADQGLIQMQQEVVNFVQKKVQEEAAAAAKKAKKVKPPKPAKKAAAAKRSAAPKKTGGKSQKDNKYMGTLEKEVISAGLTSLPDHVSGTVLEMIKADQKGLDVSEDGTLELDIDQISTPTLWQIHTLIMKYAPEVEIQVRRTLQEREVPRAPVKPAPKKKNKPMSKGEQERKIEQLKNSVQEFERQGSGSQEPILPKEQNDTSGDDDSDSEEE